MIAQRRAVMCLYWYSKVTKKAKEQVAEDSLEMLEIPTLSIYSIQLYFSTLNAYNSGRNIYFKHSVGFSHHYVLWISYCIKTTDYIFVWGSIVFRTVLHMAQWNFCTLASTIKDLFTRVTLLSRCRQRIRGWNLESER